MLRKAVLGMTLLGLLLATSAYAAEKNIPIRRGTGPNPIDPYWDGSAPMVLSKSAAADTAWVQVHDDSSC